MVFQLISNGLMIPMTASATDDVVTEQTPEQKAQAKKEAEKQVIEKATKWVDTLFTDSTRHYVRCE